MVNVLWVWPVPLGCTPTLAGKVAACLPRRARRLQRCVVLLLRVLGRAFQPHAQVLDLLLSLRQAWQASK